MPHVNPAHPAHTHLPARDVVPTEAQLPSLYHAYSKMDLMTANFAI